MTRTRKTIAASIAALTLGVTLAASATPADAAWRRHHHRHGWGAPVAAGVVGALALGAIAASAAPAYGTCVVRQRAYDDWGNFVGYRRVRVAC